MPVGVTGELYIGGIGVARGYLNRPELTAEKFVPNPYGKEAGARLYRTGDRVRMSADGNIEYLGRRDEQVKVRGFRIELGEIESVLAEHASVREVVVMAREGVGGVADKRLVAYVVGAGSEGISTRELQEYVKERLPQYMIPSVFIEMESMPLTPNGKVDRRALPAPEQDRMVAGNQYEAPRTAVEQVLARIWSEVLGIENVGINDNFFELGGDSILSIRIIAKANQAHLRLMPRQIFEHQTIAQLASVARPVADIEIRQEMVTGDVPLTPVQHWFFEQQLTDPHHFNQAIMFEVEQRMDVALLERAWRELIVHHDALRLRFRQEGGGYRQVNVGIEDATPFVRIDVSGLPEAEQESALEAEAARIQASLNLAAGPLLQLAVFERGTERAARLLFVIHHLMIDHVSWQILLDDLQTAYQQLSRDEAVKLPAKTTSFQQWARRLTTYAQSETLREELPYWSATSRRNVSPLPADNPDGENTEASVQTVTVFLESAETQALLQKVSEAYRTQVHETLLAALAQSYSNWTGERSLLVDLEGHGREEIFEDVDLSRTVGWFTTIFPVLLDVDEASSVEASLKQVKEQLRRIPQRGIGYGLLRYLSQDSEVAEQLRTLPQSDVIFNYVGRRHTTKPEDFTLEAARESSGALRSPRQRRRYLLEINGGIAGGRLYLEWNYSENRHRRETIQKWADGFIATLRALIAHCETSDAGGYTPSDFPLAKLNQTQLDKLIGNRRGIEDIYPLSPIQQGLLFHTLYAPEAGLYFLQVSCTLKGDLNPHAFKQAWQEVASRHPALRTEFVWEGLSEPLQVVRASAEIPVEEEDWRGLPEAEQQARLQSFFEADRARGFELTTPPLMRVTLLRTADNVYQVVWSHHHLIVDGWSGPLLLRECIAFYEALRKQETIQLTRSRPYRDYIAWLQKQDLSEAEKFWRESLKGFTKPTPVLGTQAVQSNTLDGKDNFGEQKIHLNAEATAALQQIARRHKLTLNTISLGAWAFVLSYMSGENDVVFGTAVAGRPPELAGAESIVGVFINTLPLRVRLSPYDAVLPWLQTIQEQQVRMRQFEYSPLVKVQEWSDAPRGESLFESFLVFENFWLGDSTDQQQSTLEIRNIRYRGRENYAIGIVVGPGPELVLKISYYHPRLNARNTMRMLRQLEAFLVHLVARPDITLQELRTLFEETDRQNQLLQEQELKNAQLQKFKKTKRKPVSGTQPKEVTHYEESAT